ncbi:membrane-associated protein, putative [Bodo saltans]|uniref:Membrane-associated protein, putative n=1 Tax=Bodo saltans TaxID=75058 RepID=A0A0S4JTS9_BODSA|nr:membrane-associated protein, putative [Bodo saltans]|eukprot:CUG92828.1 membrane-associated protein, putative [Bodo saltans]
MVGRLMFFAVHCVAHVCLYLVPRCLFYILVKLPITLIEQQLGEQRSFPENDFLMEVVTNWWDKSTLRFFGIVERGMEYPRPLYGGHMQTLMGATRVVGRPAYRRVVVTADDSNPICLDWSVAPTYNGKQVRGVFLVVPGLASSSSSSYIRQFVLDANKDGFHCCVINARGMGSTPVTAPQLIGAVFTADIRAVLRDNIMLTSAAEAAVIAHTSFPIQAIGFSLGGAILSNYLAEESLSASVAPNTGLGLIKAAYAVCAPYDMHESANHMLRLSQMLIYQPNLTKGLKNYLRRHKDIVEIISNMPNADESVLSTVRTVQEFETVYVAPHFGFKCREDYYTASSVMEGKLEHVAIPMMCIGAQDDPIVGPPPHLRRWERIAQTNKNIVFVGLPAGGHLGFLGNPLDELMGATEAAHLLVLHAARNALSLE